MCSPASGQTWRSTAWAKPRELGGPPLLEKNSKNSKNSKNVGFTRKTQSKAKAKTVKTVQKTVKAVLLDVLERWGD